LIGIGGGQKPYSSINSDWGTIKGKEEENPLLFFNVVKVWVSG